MNQKGFAPIFVILFILFLIIIGGMYFLTKTEGKPCGGFVGEKGNFACPAGYKCQYPLPKYPDDQGKCVNLINSILSNSKTISTAVSPTVQPTKTIISSTPTAVDETANWKTYTNNELAYQFKYPVDWVVDTNKSKSSTTKHLVIGFITSAQQGLMGITYCGAHAEDKSRCESFKINDSDVAAIDWGANQDDGANVIISHPKGGAISFYLIPVLSESKKIFYQILSTFKFN